VDNAKAKCVSSGPFLLRSLRILRRPGGRLEKLAPFVSGLCGATEVLLFIAAFYFVLHAWPLAIRLDEERRFRIAAENAPICLGLHKDPIDFLEQDEEDES
jgi:hypothetical protein